MSVFLLHSKIEATGGLAQCDWCSSCDINATTTTTTSTLVTGQSS